MPDARTPVDPAEAFDLDGPSDLDGSDLDGTGSPHQFLGPAWSDVGGEPPAQPGGRQRWWDGARLRSVAVVVAASTLVGVVTWQRTSAVDAQRVQDQQARTLRVVVGGGGLLAARAPDSGDYNTRAALELDLVNAGPMAVTLLEVTPTGSLARMSADLDEHRDLAPAEVERIVVAGIVLCPLGGNVSARSIGVRLRTADGSERDVDLPTPAEWTDGLQRACALRVGAATVEATRLW